MKKRYNVAIENFDQKWECVIAVDLDFKTPTNISVMECMQSMVNFWDDSKIKLEEADGDYLVAFLRQLAERAFRIRNCYNLTTEGIIEHIKKEEGWGPLDGTWGIQLEDTDSCYYDSSYFTITELNGE